MEHFVSCPGSRWQVFGEIKRQLVASSEAADTNSSLLETKDTKLQQQEPIVWRMVDSTNKKKNLHLFLADRGKIRWGRLASRSADKRKGLLVNYFRAFDSLTNKVALCKSVRYWAASAKQRDATFMPESYVLKPTNLEAQAGGGERTEFLAAIAQETQQEDPTKNIWIVKSDKGAKGDDIFIGRSADQVFTFIDSKFVIPKQSDTIAITAAEAEAEAKLPPWKRKTGLKKKPKSQASWIVQRYIGNPFLLSGRKFDIRVWVLLTSTSYQIYVYNEAVFRTSSVEYKLDDLSNRFAHLTNHCIQEQHPEFGTQEAGNELFYAEFQQYLTSINSPFSVDTDLKPQINAIVQSTLSAVRDVLEVTPDAGYSCFQLFGYDFMIDADFTVHLLEINATPAVAAEKLSGLVEDLIEVAITPHFTDDTPQTMNPGNQWQELSAL